MAFAIQDSILGAVDIYTPDNSGPGPYSLAGASAGKMGRYEYTSAGCDGEDPILGGGFFLYAQVGPIASQTISSIAVASGVATITMAAAHGLSVGSVIQITGATPAGFNGLWTLSTVATTTTATFSVTVTTLPNYCINNGVVNPPNPSIPTTAATVMGTYVAGIGFGQVVQFVHTKDVFGQLIMQAQAWTGVANSGLSLGVAVCNPLALTATSVPANPFGGQFAWFQVGGAVAVFAAGVPAIGAGIYWANAGGAGIAGGVTQVTVASKQMQGAQFCSLLGASFGTGATGTWTLPSNMALMWGTFPLAQGAIS